MSRKLFALLFVAGLAFAAPQVTKVEPPNWWPGHSLNHITLLIRGTALTGATITAPRGLKARNIRVNASGTYLQVDIEIARNATPGDYPLEIHSSTGTTTAPFRLEAPLDPSGRFQGFSQDDVIYLIMPDRFANGDPSNDDPAISPGLFDRAKPHRYHGGDLQGIIDHLPYIKSLGVTAIWFTPIYDNTNRLNRQQAVNGEPIADYHGYGAVDYYGVEEHFGTLELTRKLVDEAHRLGLKVIQDQVANHIGPGHPWVLDPPKPTWFHGTASQHLDETWQIWDLADPNASAAMKRAVLDGWFANILPDMDQEDPDVAQYEIQNALWWVGETGFDGIRQDTLPYVPRTFWRDWSAALHKQYPKLRIVGEVFDGDPAVPSFFQGGGVDTVFDFPTYFNIREVFARGGGIDAFAKTLAKDRFYADPSTLVTFLGLHDVARFMNESGASAAKLKLAFTYLATTRGTPMIYYGDEIGMPGGEDPDNRRDFPGGWKGDARNAFDPAGRSPQEQDIFNHVQKVMTLRAQLEPLRRGKLIDLVVNSSSWAFARETSRSTALVVINNASEPADISVPFSSDGSFSPQLTPGPAVTVTGGKGTIHLPATTAEIYLLK